MPYLIKTNTIINMKINLKFKNLIKIIITLTKVLYFVLIIFIVSSQIKLNLFEMTKIKFLYLLLLILFIQNSNCGRILSGDIQVDYANAGQMTKLSFSFMLQNSIDQNDYIKVALPFPLHSKLVPAFPATQGLSIPLGVILTYQSMDNSSNILATINTGQILTQTIDSSNYFIRFYAADKKTFIPIPANNWYYITFQIKQTDPLQYQKSNSILQIQLSTVSSVWSNAMVYDDNLAFNYFSLASTPSQSITLAVSPYNFGNAGGYLLTQNQYALNLDVTLNLPSYQYTQNLVLKFLISSKKTFLWSGTCGSIAKTNAPRINQLNASLYTCSIDTTLNIINVILNPAALALQTSFRFTAIITNPPIVVKNVDIVVRAVKQVSRVIIGYGQATAALNTNQIYVTYQQIFIGWGLRPDALLPFDARIFRANSATPTYMPYNSLSLKFSVSQSTSSAVQLKIIIDVPSQSGAFVLQNGFTSNLPAASNKIVKCVTEYASTGASRRIGCTGVGALTVGTVYEIGWKMFFPYDNYESAIDCTQFGTLTVYTTQMISVDDNVFFLGRGNQFLTYLKTSPDFYVIGRNASYITYMKTFQSLNLVVLSQDFQQFLNQPESIYITNRPYTYLNKQFSDVYVIRQNLAFLTYMSLFNDIYIAAKLKSDTDIVKAYDTYPLIAKSTPKNTLTITTSNSKDWDDQSDSVPVISTVSGSSNAGGTGLISGLTQSLVFQFRAPFAQITTVASTPTTTITDNWGMMIMMSPKIKFNGGTVTVVQTPSVAVSSVFAETISTVSAYNKYTMITVRAATNNNLLNTFPSTTTTKTIGFYPFQIASTTFSSIYANDDNLDIMIATVDGIDGPSNKIKYNGFFLINSFTMLTSTLGTLNYGFVNYDYATPMDGSKIPTMLRIKGSISDSSSFDSLSIFFDKMTPFYSNYYTGDVFCKSTEGTPYCKFSRGYQTAANTKNYQTLSRIDIPMTNPSAAFNIFIPFTFSAGQTSTNLYIGYQKLVAGKKSLLYIQPMRTITITVAPSAAVGNYGPIVTSAFVGQTITNMGLKANQGGTAPLANTGNNIGSAFSYFSQWDFIKGSTVTGFQSFGTCHKMKYLYYYTNYNLYLTGTVFSYSYKTMNGIVCPADISVAGLSSASLTISSGYLPSKWGKKIPGFGAYSQNNGQLIQYKFNWQVIGGNLLIANSVQLPPAGKLLVNAVGQFVIPLQAPLDGNTDILIVGASGTTNIPFISQAQGTCAIFYLSKKMPISCNFASSPTQLQYTLIINQQGLLPAGGNFSIVHYGLKTNSSYTTVNVDISVSSLLNNPTPLTNDLIFKKTAVSFAWQGANYIGQSQLKVGSFKQWTTNKATVQDFQFTFTLLGKGLYVTNRVRFDLGQFAVDNGASSVNPNCKVFDYNAATGSNSFSHDWMAVDSSQGLSKLQIWPQKLLISNNLTYLIRCQNFLSTSSPNPAAISAMIANTSSDMPGQLSSSNSIVLSVLTPASSAGQISLTKSYTIPSTVMEMFFQIISPGINSDSILYLNFPSYYSNGLGPDIKCYSSNQIYCTVTNRKMTVRYLGDYASGTTFTLKVAGVSRSINYNSGTFSYVIDTDDDPTTILTSGTFIDAASSNAASVQNFPIIPILTLKQSSTYLRQEGVTITADFYLPSTLTSIGVGQSLMMVFPATYFDVMRFIKPTCVLNIKGNTLKNYISSCSVVGMRLKMIFLDYIVTGSSYSLTITGIINPTNPTSNIQRYSFQISNAGDTSIIAKSYAPNCNYRMPLFVLNPVRNSLNYYTTTNGLITNLITKKNIQSQNVFISTGIDYVNSKYDRNAVLQPFNNLYTNPSNIQLSSGSNPFAIRFSSLNSGVNYIYFSKTGDGSYYSNLPPLILTTNKNYFTPVSFVQTSFSLPVNTVGTNYTICVTLPAQLYPMSQVNMTVTLSTSVGVSLRINPTVILFYPTKVTAYINLYINDATQWTVGRTTNLVITPQDSTYAAATSIPLNAVAAPQGAPVITVVTGTIAKKEANFTVTCSEQGKLLYHVSRFFSYNITACSLNSTQIKTWSASASIDGLRVSQTYYQCQDQISVINIAKNVATTVRVQNLDASLAYTFQAVCQTQANIMSNLSTTNFSTLSNGGLVNQMSFYFTAKLTTSQKIKLVCALALFFNFDYQRVSTWDGYYCSQLLSRRLLIQQTSQPDEIQQKTSIRKNEIKLQQSQALIKNMYQLSHRALQAAVYETVVFFGINNNLLTDNTRTAILANASLLNLKNELNTNVTGLPTLDYYSTNYISNVGSVNDISGTFRFDVGPNYLYLQGLQLTNPGLVYIIIGNPALWSRDPLVSQIKKGSGPDGLPPAYFRILCYNSSNPVTTYMAWIDMEPGAYTAYVMASDANPFDTAIFGPVRKYTFSQQVPKWQVLLTTIKVMSLIMLLGILF